MNGPCLGVIGIRSTATAVALGVIPIAPAAPGRSFFRVETPLAVLFWPALPGVRPQSREDRAS